MEIMKILFIYPDIDSGNYMHFHFGIGSISSVLKRAGYDTSLLYLKNEMDEEDFLEEVTGHFPDVIAFSTTTNQWKYTKKYSQIIKKSLDKLVICGGNHPTLAPEEVIGWPAIDIVCRGEGEYALLELLDCFAKGQAMENVENLWVKVNGKIKENPLRPLISNLDNLSMPDRTIFHYHKILNMNRGGATIMAGRGCPYNCSYCCNASFNELYKGKGKKIRVRSPSQVIEELKFLKKNYSVRFIDFMDEAFTFNKDWMKEFFSAYKREINLPFDLMIRPEMANPSLLTLLKDSGLSIVRMGIESGNERLRREILNRPISNQKIIRAFKTAQDFGVKTWSFNMIGLPFETPRMIQDTICLNKLIKPDHIQVSIFYPYPGTELYKRCKDEGFLSGELDSSSFFDCQTILEQPTLSPKQVARYYKKFLWISWIIKLKKEKWAVLSSLWNSFIRNPNRLNLLSHYLKFFSQVHKRPLQVK